MAEAMSPETAAKALQQSGVQKGPHPPPTTSGQCHEAQMHKALSLVALANFHVASTRQGPFQLEQAEAKQRAPSVAMAVLVVTSSESLSG